MVQMMDMDRRAMLGRMAVLLGAAAVPAQAFAGTTPRAKAFLNPGRMTLLSAVSETIIPQTNTPGALAAKVPARFDALLVDWASAERRTELVGALSEIDALAMAQEKMGFVALSPAKRAALLTAHDLASLKNVPRTEKLTGIAALMAGPAVANPAYSKLRELIILLFFCSEEALTSVLTYELSPGSWTPSIKVTPETRNTGGLDIL